MDKLKEYIPKIEYTKYRMAAVISYAVLLVFFFLNKDFYIAQGQIIVKNLLVVCGVSLIMMLAAGLPQISDNKLNIVYTLIMLVLSIFLTMYMVEYVNGNVQNILNSKKVLLVNLIVWLAIIGTGWILTFKIKGAITIMIVVSLIFSISNFYVYKFRGIPLLAADLTTVGTALNVAGNYSYAISYEVFLELLVSLSIVVLAFKIKEDKKLNLKTKGFFYGLYIICLGGFLYAFIFTDIVRVQVNTFNPQKAYNKNGSILTFIRSTRSLMVEKPEDYSTEEVDKILKKYAEDSEKAEGKTPNVIVIMNEAFSDLQELGIGFETNYEVMPFYDSLAEDCVKGDVYVSVFGGRTANSEFEFLTGNSMAFLPEASAPYQTIIRDKIPSLVYTLKSYGYEGNIAMHPFNATGYARNRAYPLLGFDKFLSLEDFDDSNMVRAYVSDDACVDKIIEEYEAVNESSDAPYFAFNVTMQNHSSWYKDFDNLPKDITVDAETKEAYAVYLKEKGKDKVDAETEISALERYLNLIHLSDKSLEKIVNYFKNVEEDTVIVFFGDHQPKLDDTIYEFLLGKKINKMSYEEAMQRYHTPFVIWANYDIEEELEVVISMNYLSTYMMASANMDLPPYNKFLLELSEEIPILTSGGYIDKYGEFYDNVYEKDSPLYEMLLKAWKLQYNRIIDTDNRSEYYLAE